MSTTPAHDMATSVQHEAQRRHSSSETMGEDTEAHNTENGGQQNDDAEKAEKEQKPQPVGFWHSHLNTVRKQVVLLWLRTTVILMTFIIAVLSLYWAVLFNVEENLEALSVAVVDFDGQLAPYLDIEPMIGPMITDFSHQQAQSSSPHLGFVSQPPSRYNNDPLAVRQAIYDQHDWAAIIINANATALLQSAVLNGNTSYDPIGACQLIYVEARDQTTVDSYLLPYLNQLMISIQSKFGETWTQKILSNDTYSRTTLSKVPQAVSPAIGFSIYNLRPFTPPTATPAVTIGLIYLIIIAFFSFSFYLPIHTRFLQPEGHPPLHFTQMILWRYSATILAYFFLSLAYSLVSLAFQIPFSNPPAPDTVVATSADAYHHGTFPVYWMLNFLGMCALGLASENVSMFIGQPWTGLWLIFWVITNVCTSFYEIRLSPRFFYWGYAWPLHNIVEASRTILFGLHGRIGLNFGILVAWAAVNTALFPIACAFMRWKTMKGQGKRMGLREVWR